MPILAGTVTFTEQPRRRRWNTTNGWHLIRTWRGAKTNLNLFIQNLLPPGSIEVEVEERGASATVRATYGVEAGHGTGGTQIADPINRNWELISNDVEISLWAMPKVATLLAAKTPDELREIRRLMNQALDGEIWISFAEPILDDLYKRLAAGIETKFETQYVLRKVETVTTATALTVSHSNVGLMHTYAQLIASETTLPGAVLIQPGELDHLFWLKRAPQNHPTSRGNREITQEYWGFEAYDPWIYDPVT